MRVHLSSTVWRRSSIVHSAGMRPARTSSQLGLLGRVIAPNVVRRVLQESHAGDRLRGAFRDDEERVCRSYRKTFAILVLVDMVCNVPDFTLCGLDDLRLPMPDVGTRDASPPPDETSREVTRKWPRRDVDHFKTYQWHVLAPVFTAQDSEYSLCPSHIPFVESHEQPDGGGFATVYRMRIHRDHCDFGKFGVVFPGHTAYGIVFSLLAAVYLPTTAMATIFAMSVFEWTNDWRNWRYSPSPLSSGDGGDSGAAGQSEQPVLSGYLWVWPALSAGLKHNRLQHLPSRVCRKLHVGSPNDLTGRV